MVFASRISARTKRDTTRKQKDARGGKKKTQKDEKEPSSSGTSGLHAKLAWVF
jgi:hypothetical protein